MSPRIAELAEKYKGNPKVKIAKLDVDHNEAVAMEHRVLSLPTFKLFHKGEIVDELIGAVPVDALDSMITRALGTAPAA
jgi:thioredoxin 1